MRMALRGKVASVSQEVGQEKRDQAFISRRAGSLSVPSLCRNGRGRGKGVELATDAGYAARPFGYEVLNATQLWLLPKE